MIYADLPAFDYRVLNRVFLFLSERELCKLVMQAGDASWWRKLVTQAGDASASDAEHKLSRAWVKQVWAAEDYTKSRAVKLKKILAVDRAQYAWLVSTHMIIYMQWFF